MTKQTLQRAVEISEELERAKNVYAYTGGTCQIAFLTTLAGGAVIAVPAAARKQITEAIHESVGEYIKSLESELEKL